MRFGEVEGLSIGEKTGVAMIADGAEEVLRRVREPLMLGASQSKIVTGGGVTSIYDPLDAPSRTSSWSRATRLRTSKLIADPARNIRLIMKDGKVFKDTLGVM